MLHIKKVSMRNFLSVGNAPQEVGLNRDGLTLVLGENLDLGGVNSRNGVGKSTILQAISFGLFGIPLTNIKKDNLVNSINARNMVVAIDFENDGKSYRIERGRKPQFIRYYVNDGLVNNPETDESQGDSKFTQIEIDKVLGLSHDMFRHIVAINTYTDPFLKMKAGEQRLLIEELLGITQISHRSDNLKELVKNTKDGIKEEEVRIRTVLESNQRIQKAIDDLKLKHESWETQRNRRIDTARSTLNSLQTLDVEAEVQAHKTLEEFKVLSTEYNRAKKELNRLTIEMAQKAVQHERKSGQLDAAMNHKCHACGHDIHDDSHEAQVKQLQAEFERIETDLVAVATSVENQQIEVDALKEGLDLIGDEPTTQYATLEEALEHRNTLNNLLDTIKREEESSNPYSDQIWTLKATGLQEISYEDLNEMQTLLRHQDFLLKLLTSKDSFIRKKIIDQNINHLNHRLNFYLEKLNLPHEVKFKSDLSVEISLLGRDFDYEQLSRGEMSRVNLSTSWAFRDIYESLNRPINLLFVDEALDNGIDAQGGEAALDLMKRMARDRGRNIFLVSHKEELIGRVNQILMVKKENSFTQFGIDEAGE